MQNKPLLNYPEHPEFEELLNSCGSMTKQLENLGHTLNVDVLHEGIENDCFRRYTILKLNTTPVVIACSSTMISNSFFTNLLKNANTTPIGKFLFAPNSQVQRAQIDIQQIAINDIRQPHLQDFAQQKYQYQQHLWQRNSLFTCHHEIMELCEIILPELDKFY